MIFCQLTIVDPPNQLTPLSILYRLRLLAKDAKLIHNPHNISPDIIKVEGIRISCRNEFSYEKLLQEEIFIGSVRLIIREISGRSAFDNPYLLESERRIYLRKVPSRIRESDLLKHFSQIGEIESVRIMKYNVNFFNKSNGRIVGHVFFDDPESAKIALESKYFCMRGCKIGYESFQSYLERRQIERSEQFEIIMEENDKFKNMKKLREKSPKEIDLDPINENQL